MKPATPMTTATGDKYPKKKDKTVDDMKGMEMKSVHFEIAENGFVVEYHYESKGKPGEPGDYETARHVFTDKKSALEHLTKYLA